MKLFHANGAPVLGATMFSAGGDGGAGGGEAAGQGDGGQGDPPGDDDGDDDDSSGDTARLLDALKKERRRAREAERELKPLKTAAQQRADAEKSDAQKAIERAEAAERERDDLRSQVRQTRVERAVREADRSLNLGLHDADLVADLLSLDDDDFDRDGRPIAKSVAKKVGDLVKARPYLAGAGTQSKRPGGGDGGSGGGAPGGGGMNDLIRRAAGRG